MTAKEVRKKRAQLEAERKKLEDEVKGLYRRKDSLAAEIEKKIKPIQDSVYAVNNKLYELSKSCPKRDDEDEHGEAKYCSLCGYFTPIDTGVD